MPTVNMFNSNYLPVNVNVNNAPATFAITAAAPPNWTPGVPATNPTCNPGPPTPGNFGIGMNNVVLTPQGSTSPFVAHISLDPAVQWMSIQIYIFFQSFNSCSFVVLNNGQMISQGTALSQHTLAKIH